MALEEFFTWGKDGRKMTPDQLAAERAALAVMQAKEGDTSPVAHWSQGLGRVVNALAGNYREGKADKAEAAGIAQGQAAMDPVLRAIMGGASGGASGGPVAAAAIPAWSPQPAAPGLTDVPAPTADLSLPGVSPMAPEGAGGLAFGDMQPKLGSGPITGEAIVNGLVQRGMPPHVAQGFAMNFADESAFNPNAVGDNGNAFGLAQWNGPRMAALQDYAAQAGTPASDPNTQLDYLMTELQGPESGAMAQIAATDTPQAAAQAVLNNFERPAEAHRARREAAYAGGGMPSTSYAGGGNPVTMSTQGQPAPQGDILSLLMSAQADPWAAKQYGPVINALMGSELTNRQQAQDPLRQLQIQQAQMELQKAQRPQTVEVGGVLLDANTYQPIFDSRTSKGGDSFTLGAGDVRYGPDGKIIAQGSPKEGFRIATPEEAKSYGSTAGQFGADGRFYPVDVPQGMTIESDGAGGFRMVQGPAGTEKPFTEAQSKDVVFGTRAQGALDVLDPIAGELTSRTQRAAEFDPTGFARGAVQSDQFQIAKNAGDEFLQALLRKDSGAAITPSEQALYGTTYLPQPGDNEALLEAKKAARRRAVTAIQAGMNPAQIVATEKALALGEPVAPPEGNPNPISVKKRRWNPEKGAFE